ncbi:MAG: lipopolysaccharide biosynthesis protein [Actinomycetia bacterium]|nr:lipopolysaccharide biosynthesis protein [Actinomycetes bacterium]MCP5034338.1 lipopolysaccharide biosynthesis protein [Actinomycetes bacterium]
MSPVKLWSRVWYSFDGLAGDTLWSGAHDLTQLVTAFSSFLLLQRALSLEEYGAYIGLYGLLGAFGAISYAGVGLALLQRLVGEGDDPNETLKSFLSVALLIGVAASVIGSIIGAVVLPLTTVEIALVVAAELLGVAVVFVSAMLVQAATSFPAATRVKLGVIVLRLVIVLGLAAADQLTILNLAAGFLSSFTVYAAYLLIIHLPRHGYRVSFGLPSALAWRSSAMFSIPMGASKLQTDADKFLLNVFRYHADAGLYGAAYRLVLLGALPLLALDTAAFQRFLPKGEGQPGLHWRRSTRLAALMAVASSLVAVALYLLLPYFDFLFAEEFKEAMDIVPWLLLLIPLIATSNTPMNGLLGLGRTDKRMMVYVSSAVVSLVLYFVLIPSFSWQGAFVATIISELYLSAAGWTALWYYQRRADRDLDGGSSSPIMSTA